MPSTTRSMKGSASSSSISDIGTSTGKKRGLFAPSPPSKRTQQQQPRPADEDEQEEGSKDGVAQPASEAGKLSQPSKQATLYSVKLGAAGRLQRAEGKGAAAAAAGEGGKRRKLDDAEAEVGPSGGSADASGSRSSAGKMKAEDVDDQPSPSRRNRSRTRSPTPRLPTDFKQVTSPTFLSTCYTPFPGCHYLSSFLPSPTTTSSSEPSNTTLTRWYDSLASLPNWYNPTLKVYGREIVQSRPIAAFSKVQGLQLRYSGQDAKMDPWPDVLKEMEDLVRDRVGREVRFNHAFLNWYEDGRVGIGRHSDNLENRVIITLSLGAPRKWIMTRRPPRGATAAAKKSGVKLPPAERKAWTLENGSLLVMQGDVQSEWYHEVPKEAKVKEGRISVTFRQLVYD